MAEANGHADGRVVRVIGPVVDVEFPPNQLPEINNALKVDVTLSGETTTITCEVVFHGSHLNLKKMSHTKNA